MNLESQSANGVLSLEDIWPKCQIFSFLRKEMCLLSFLGMSSHGSLRKGDRRPKEESPYIFYRNLRSSADLDVLEVFRNPGGHPGPDWQPPHFIHYAFIHSLERKKRHSHRAVYLCRASTNIGEGIPSFLPLGKRRKTRRRTNLYGTLTRISWEKAGWTFSTLP